MSHAPRVTMRWPEARLEEIDGLVERGLFISRSEAIRSLAERSLDEAKANGPIEIVIKREDGRNYRGQADEDHQREILDIIDERDGSVPQADLHTLLDVSRAKVSQLLSKMESEGVVSRRPMPGRGRSKLVERKEQEPAKSNGTYYATRTAGRSNGVLHTSRNCPHIANLPDSEIIDGSRDAFDPDQGLCKICRMEGVAVSQ